MTDRAEERKPPFEVLFAAWALMGSIAVMDILGVVTVVHMVTAPVPAWAPWLLGFILLRLSVIGASFAQALEEVAPS
jgi:hypothetical protein